jgi:hypothetical protein
MITVVCDWCRQSIDTVAYSIIAINCQTNQPLNFPVQKHLHFDGCLTRWDEYMHGGHGPISVNGPLLPLKERRHERKTDNNSTGEPTGTESSGTEN